MRQEKHRITAHTKQKFILQLHIVRPLGPYSSQQGATALLLAREDRSVARLEGECIESRARKFDLHMTGILDFIGMNDGERGKMVEKETSESTGLLRCDSASDAVKTQVRFELEQAISELEEQRKLETLSARASEVTSKTKSMKPTALDMLRHMFVRPKSEPITREDEDRESATSMASKKSKSMPSVTPSKTESNSKEHNSFRGSGTWSRLGSMQSTHRANTPRPMDIPSRRNNSATTWDSQSLASQYVEELDLYPCIEGGLKSGDGEEDTTTNAFYHHRIAVSAPPTRNDNRFEELRSVCSGFGTALSDKPHDVTVDTPKIFYVDPSNVDDILAKRDSFVSDSSPPRGTGRSHSLGPAAQSLLTRARSQAANKVRGSHPNFRGRMHNSQQHPMHPKPQTVPVESWDAEEYPLLDRMLRRNHTAHTPSSQISSVGEGVGDHGTSSTGARQGNSLSYSNSIPLLEKLNQAAKKWARRPIYASAKSSFAARDRTKEGYPQGVSSPKNTDQPYSTSHQNDSTKQWPGNDGRSSTMTTFSMFIPSRIAVLDLSSTSTQATQDHDWTSADANESMDQHNNWESDHKQRTWAEILATDHIPISPESIKYDSYATYSPVSLLESESEVDQRTGSQEVPLCYIPDDTERVYSPESPRGCSQDSKSMLWKGKHNEPADIDSDLRSKPTVSPPSLPVRQREFLPQSPLDDDELSSGHSSPLSSQYTSSPKSQYSQPTTPRNVPHQSPLLVAQNSLETIPPRWKPLQHAQTLPNTCYIPPLCSSSNKPPARLNLTRPSRTLPISFDTARTQSGDAFELTIQPLRIQKVTRNPFESSIQPLRIQKVAKDTLEQYKKGAERRWREAEERLKAKRDGRGGDRTREWVKDVP
jgi:hypothetical protein